MNWWHRFRHGHEPYWRACCYDGMGHLWSCDICLPEPHPSTAHGFWR